VTNSITAYSADRHPGIVLATLSLANIMAVMDLFVVNVALHDIGVSFDYLSSPTVVTWVLTGCALIFGSLLIPAGRFADKYGRKQTFILGIAVFTVASLACALAPDLWTLVAFRCVQAAGAAMLIPSSLGLVLTTMPPQRVKSSVRCRYNQWTASTLVWMAKMLPPSSKSGRRKRTASLHRSRPRAARHARAGTPPKARRGS
jgi:MFS family permease